MRTSGYIKYSLPAIFSLLFLSCVAWGRHWYYLILLAMANIILNRIWGEFTEREMRTELGNFHRADKRLLKVVNAFVIIGCIFSSLYLWDQQQHTFAASLGFACSLGIVTACFAVTLAHELSHEHHPLAHSASNILLLTAGIPHFSYDHIFGHHRLIGLEEDFTTARQGQHFYAFFLTCFVSRFAASFVNIYQLPEAVFRTMRKYNFTMFAGLLGLYILLYILARFPAQLLIVFFIQGLIAYLFYELINYIQHYGLRRHKLDPLRPEPVALAHSWNSYYKFTNYILYFLPLHSAHHAHRNIGRDELLSNGPRMPYYYFIMVLMALIPAWWFHKMDPLADKYSAPQLPEYKARA